MDLVAGLASCLRDERQAGKVDHSLRELVAQRVFSIACGYPDANDSARLSGDPIHKLLLDRDPIEGRELASQPTLSRFENGVGVKELYRAGEFLAESVIRRHAKPAASSYLSRHHRSGSDRRSHARRAAVVVLHGHYDTWCYLPVMGFVSFNDEAEQYLCAAVLRPGNVTAAVGAVAMLRRLVRMIRHRLSWGTDSGTPGWRLRASAVAGVFGRPAQTRICGCDGQKCGVEARRRKRNATSAPALAAQRKTEHIYGEVR